MDSNIGGVLMKAWNGARLLGCARLILILKAYDRPVARCGERWPIAAGASLHQTSSMDA